MKTVLVVGATGRVGGAVASSLVKHSDDVHVLVAGRRRAVGEALAARLGQRARFMAVDLADRASLLSAMASADLVINTAGPFQMAEPRVLDAAIEAGLAANVALASVVFEQAHALARKGKATGAAHPAE